MKRLCSYLVNARKKPKKKKHDNKYSYNVRYYFTSAKVTHVNQQAATTTGPNKKLFSKNNLHSSMNMNLIEIPNVNGDMTMAPKELGSNDQTFHLNI